MTIHLPHLGNDVPEPSLEQLPKIRPYFFVPRLADQPQNPIMDTLKAPIYAGHRESLRRLPKDPGIMTEYMAEDEDKQKTSDTLWLDCAKLGTRAQSHILAWDALRLPYSSRASFTPFLSEQSDNVFAAVQYHIYPSLRDPNEEVIYVQQHEFLNSLRKTVIGISSMFHTWDTVSERFFQTSSSGKILVILIDGKDRVVSDSVIRRFTTIGTLMRRLEMFTNSNRSKTIREGPTVHAFAYAVSLVLEHLRHNMSSSFPISGSDTLNPQALVSIWVHFSEYEEILVALCTLCNRDINTLPSAYPPFDTVPAQLLSLIYEHLDSHLERGSTKNVPAILAYILSNTSLDYFQSVCFSVGLGHSGSSSSASVSSENRLKVQSSEEYERFHDDDDFQDLEDIPEETYPAFFPKNLLEALPAAKRSLKLLKAACPDHLFLRKSTSHTGLSWFWTEADVVRIWNNEKDVDAPPPAEIIPDNNVDDKPSTSDSTSSADVTKFFKIFELEPGSHLAHSMFVSETIINHESPLQAFIRTFPSSLPRLTPTLSHLTSLVLAPLTNHVTGLSSALLSLFLSTSSTLNIHIHLSLLRSYLLLTSHSFKSRLATALFSDADSEDDDGIPQGTRMLTHARRRTATNASEKPWALGLAPSLTLRDTWPPGGADLSFYLRTVIVDSLEHRHGSPTNDLNWQSRKTVLQEAEFRLGFAIRDLPVGTGRDKWLDPLSIEALDFLYMDYKPPHPLGIVISPEVLSKYQRMFAFILRMMRGGLSVMVCVYPTDQLSLVETVTRALFRITRNSSNPLFPTLPSSNRLLLHFQSVAHLFTNTISSYVFDIVIPGHFDSFLARLSSHCAFSDVFSLAKSHSEVLDDVLSACLLRSGQRAIGDLLLGSLEVILEFGIVVGEIKRARSEETQAALRLECLFRTFREKVKTFTKVLKILVDKSTSSSRLSQEYVMADESRPRKPLTGSEMLYHLLLRLDLGEWWSSLYATA